MITGKFEKGDMVEYIGKHQNQCYRIPNIGMVASVTNKRVSVRWTKRDGTIGPGRTHPIRPENLKLATGELRGEQYEGGGECS